MKVVSLPESTKAQHNISFPSDCTRTRSTPRDALPLGLAVDAAATSTETLALDFLSSAGLLFFSLGFSS